MEIIRIPTGPLGTNTYIVYSQNFLNGGCKECIVIDPAASAPIIKKLQELDLKCTHILLTHGHFDHIMGVKKLKLAHSSSVCIHELDAAALLGGDGSLAYMAGAYVEKCEVDRLLKDGDEFTAAGMSVHVVHTPGHTPGGVCYIVRDGAANADATLDEGSVIFSGDTLFHLSVGRTDLAGGNGEQLYESIVYRLYSLKGDCRVLPGHEEETTLDFERKHNPYTKSGGLY